MYQPESAPAKGKTSAAALGAHRPERLPVEPIADSPAVVETDDGFHVVGFAFVARITGRPAHVARRLAERIAARPTVYLPLLRWLDADGIVDTRPTFGKAVARA